MTVFLFFIALFFFVLLAQREIFVQVFVILIVVDRYYYCGSSFYVCALRLDGGASKHIATHGERLCVCCWTLDKAFSDIPEHDESVSHVAKLFHAQIGVCPSEHSPSVNCSELRCICSSGVPLSTAYAHCMYCSSFPSSSGAVPAVSVARCLKKWPNLLQTRNSNRIGRRERYYS